MPDRQPQRAPRDLVKMLLMSALLACDGRQPPASMRGASGAGSAPDGMPTAGEMRPAHQAGSDARANAGGAGGAAGMPMSKPMMNPAGSGPDAGSDAGPAPDAGPQVPVRDTRWDEPYSGKYTDDGKWLCRPGLPNNPCAADLRITDLNADGTTSVTELPATPPDEPVDCFYTYPTVDVGLLAPPRNQDFPDIVIEPILDVVSGQVLPFRPLCNIYAPVYRQASLVSLTTDEETRKKGLEYGYADVTDAFDYYLRDVHSDRPLVLVAHSQGAMLMLRLIQRRIQDDPQLRKRLVVALLGGPLGGFIVKKGEAQGGTFEDIPLCSSAQQTGCVLTWNSFVKENPPNADFATILGPIPAEYDTGCTNPATYAGDATRMKGALFLARYRQTGLNIPLDYGGTNVTTDYARYANFYTGQCKPSSKGLSYFEVAVAPAAGDKRKNPVPFDNLALADASLGLHGLDYSFIAGDLFDAVRAKIDAHAQASP